MYASQQNQFRQNQSSVSSSSFRGCGRGKNSGHIRSNNSSFSASRQGCNRFNGNAVPSSSSTNSRISCQICNRPGHMALDCYNRMNYNFQGRHPSPQLAAMVATQNNQYLSTHQNNQYNSSPWLADSGCNAHVTSDLSNLAISSEYNERRMLLLVMDIHFLFHIQVLTLSPTLLPLLNFPIFFVSLISLQICYLSINFVLIIIAPLFLF